MVRKHISKKSTKYGSFLLIVLLVLIEISVLTPIQGLITENDTYTQAASGMGFSGYNKLYAEDGIGATTTISNSYLMATAFDLDTNSFEVFRIRAEFRVKINYAGVYFKVGIQLPDEGPTTWSWTMSYCTPMWGYFSFERTFDGECVENANRIKVYFQMLSNTYGATFYIDCIRIDIDYNPTQNMESFENSLPIDWGYAHPGLWTRSANNPKEGTHSLKLWGSSGVTYEASQLPTEFSDGYIEAWIYPKYSSYLCPMLYVRTTQNTGTGGVTIKDGYGLRIYENTATLYRITDHSLLTPPLAQANLGSWIDNKWWHMKLDIEGTQIKAWVTQAEVFPSSPLFTYDITNDPEIHLYGRPAIGGRANLGSSYPTYFDDVYFVSKDAFNPLSNPPELATLPNGLLYNTIRLDDTTISSEDLDNIPAGWRCDDDNYIDEWDYVGGGNYELENDYYVSSSKSIRINNAPNGIIVQESIDRQYGGSDATKLDAIQFSDVSFSCWWWPDTLYQQFYVQLAWKTTDNEEEIVNGPILTATKPNCWYRPNLVTYLPENLQKITLSLIVLDESTISGYLDDFRVVPSTILVSSNAYGQLCTAVSIYESERVNEIITIKIATSTFAYAYVQNGLTDIDPQFYDLVSYDRQGGGIYEIKTVGAIESDNGQKLHPNENLEIIPEINNKFVLTMVDEEGYHSGDPDFIINDATPQMLGMDLITTLASGFLKAAVISLATSTPIGWMWALEAGGSWLIENLHKFEASTARYSLGSHTDVYTKKTLDFDGYDDFNIASIPLNRDPLYGNTFIASESQPPSTFLINQMEISHLFEWTIDLTDTDSEYELDISSNLDFGCIDFRNVEVRYFYLNRYYGPSFNIPIRLIRS